MAIPEIEFLKPVMVLILWTCFMWFWMYALRLPAFSKAGIKPDEARHPGTYSDRLPPHVRSAADNYNHLHEQPTIFYAVMFLAALTGGGDHLATMVAWAYVALRIVHSIVQIVIGTVALRFLVFAAGSFCLFFLAVREALRIFL
ncbi:MAPEG family protein [Hyphomonas sp. WL0036]|uniref:MAPEG family protein n=1 Tax=Hyphomonas sediminis TaxID=2866160 RepID=UPI001C801E05|nr:MAPEG family protein [Hyphomonas sediminis]MBY9065416.1 MAPEG family protein [Hyphomonas sediminis]